MASDRLRCQFTISRDNQRHGLAEVFSGLFECRALRVGSGQLLDEGNEAAFRHMYEDGGQLHLALPSRRGDDSSATRAHFIIAWSKTAGKTGRFFLRKYRFAAFAAMPNSPETTREFKTANTEKPPNHFPSAPDLNRYLVDLGGENEVVFRKAADRVSPEDDFHLAIPFEMKVGVMSFFVMNF